MPVSLLAQNEYSYGLSAGMNFSKVQGNWAKLTQTKGIIPDFMTGLNSVYFSTCRLAKIFQ